jgi:hypothetical protein
MMSIKNEATIAINRKEHGISLSVIMPIWKKEHDGHISVRIPFFGIKTIASNEDDIHEAVEESLMCFIISAEKFGKGLESELEGIGWILHEKHGDNSLMDFHAFHENTIVEQIMETGEPFARHHLDMEFA